MCKKLIILILCISMLLTGCKKKDEEMGSDVSSISSESEESPKGTEETSVIEIEISNVEVADSDDFETEEEVPSSFDYFVFAYNIVANTLGTGNVDLLTDEYEKTEQGNKVTYVYKQESDVTGVQEIGYTFGEDVRSAYIIFDINMINKDEIISEMEQVMNEETILEYEGKFTKTINGFECTDILSINASRGDNEVPALTKESTIEFVSNDSVAILTFKPVLNE